MKTGRTQNITSFGALAGVDRGFAAAARGFAAAERGFAAAERGFARGADFGCSSSPSTLTSSSTVKGAVGSDWPCVYLQTVISGAQLYCDKGHLGNVVVHMVLGWCRGRLGHTFALVQSSVSAANNYMATKSDLGRIGRRLTGRRLGLSLRLAPRGISGAKVDYCGGTDLREVAQTEGQLLAESKHEGEHPLVCGMRYIQGVDHWIYPVAQEAVNAVPAEKQAAGANIDRVA